MVDFKALWDKALPFEPFVASCKAEHCGLWQGIYKLARIPDWALAAVPPGAGRKLLVIAEDWCGDASNTVRSWLSWWIWHPGWSCEWFRGMRIPS